MFCRWRNSSKRKCYAVPGGRGQSEDSDPRFLVSYPLLYLMACSCDGSPSELVLIQIHDFKNYSCLIYSVAVAKQSSFPSAEAAQCVGVRETVFWGRFFLAFLSSNFISYQMRILIIPQI